MPEPPTGPGLSRVKGCQRWGHVTGHSWAWWAPGLELMLGWSVAEAGGARRSSGYWSGGANNQISADPPLARSLTSFVPSLWFRLNWEL